MRITYVPIFGNSILLEFKRYSEFEYNTLYALKHW